MGTVSWFAESRKRVWAGRDHSQKRVEALLDADDGGPTNKECAGSTDREWFCSADRYEDLVLRLQWEAAIQSEDF